VLTLLEAIDPAGRARPDGRHAATWTVATNGLLVDIFAPGAAPCVISCTAAHVPPRGRARSELLAHALAYSVYQLQGRHDTITHVPSQGALVLQRAIDAGLAAKEMRAEFKDFLSAILSWRDVLKNGFRPDRGSVAPVEFYDARTRWRV
jgi:hypothetical protein